MAYGYSSKKLSNKKSLAKTRQMEPRLLLASLVMAAGVFAYPLDLGEAAIVRENGAVMDASGLVHDIDPEKVVSNDFAYNRFKEFDLNQGHIANLKFGDASTLANLVNNQININGIVNAVRNGKIDGNLIFLSPDGIAVGASGVINAGQFTGLVPTRNAFDTLYNTPANITLAAVNSLNTGSYANAKSIDIKGQVNTHSGVMLGAGIININDGAKIRSTKDLDFNSLVNISGGASAGLNGLTASQGDGGDIILTAKQTSIVKDTKIEKDTNGQDTEAANAIRWSDRSTDFSAAINIGKDAQANGVQITSSDGTVKLTAASTSTYEDSTPMTLTDTLKGMIFGEDSALEGTIDKLASNEAGANKYLFVNYSSKKNKSSVNIGTNSTITSKDIDIAATSQVEIKQSVAVPSQGKDSNGNTVGNTSAMPVAAVAISRVYNTADIVIDGNLTANGANTETGNGIKISANADTKAELSATAGGGANTSAVVGMAVLTGDTKSKVTVNAPATGTTALTATQGKVSIGADTTSDINVDVKAVGATSYVVSNVGLVNYDTNADVTMNCSINAGAVDIKAANNTTGLKLTVNNEAKSDASAKKETAQADSDQQ
ncbi:MAG: leukotoxin LktA family filamentous adhesin, partial [Anaerovibrio sp.]|nr:leukotoxin LktA family filamentous adhesin [Anaerovibrio sp.]